MSYKVEEPDGTITAYDSNRNFQFKQDPDWPLVPLGYNNELVPSNQSNALIIPETQNSNALVPASQNKALVVPGTENKKDSFGWREALAIGLQVANTQNPFSSTGKTIGESVAEGGKKALGWIINKIKNKKDKAHKTTKPQTQTQTQTKPQTQTQTKTLTAPTKYQTITYPGDIMGDYERNSIKKFEIFQRKSVPWKMPSIEAGITRMTGFEPFSATADQTFNVFYGGGSIDPFLRS